MQFTCSQIVEVFAEFAPTLKNRIHYPNKCSRSSFRGSRQHSKGAVCKGLENADEVKDAFRSAEARSKAFEQVVRHDPINPEKLHEISSPAGRVADTFRSATYHEVVTKEPTKVYRVYTNEKRTIGDYWSFEKPTSAVQATLDSAIDPAWNKATPKSWVSQPKSFVEPNGP